MTRQVQCLSHSLQCWPPPFPSMDGRDGSCVHWRRRHKVGSSAASHQQPATSHQPPGTREFLTLFNGVQVAPVSIHLTVDVHFPLSITGKPLSISGIPISDNCSIWPGIYSLHSSPIVFSKVIIFYWKRYFSAIYWNTPRH